jgi:hypothetical protein
VKDTPEKITDRFIIQNAEYSLGSPSREWQTWIWTLNQKMEVQAYLWDLLFAGGN